MTYSTNILKNLCTVDVPTPNIQPMLRISDVVAMVNSPIATRFRRGTAAARDVGLGSILSATRLTRYPNVSLDICKLLNTEYNCSRTTECT